MNKFKVGDKVIITQPCDGMGLIGASAKVVCVDGYVYGLEISGWLHGHSLGGRTDNIECGWWVPERCIKSVKVSKGNK